jgi:hypothetical protein
MDVGDPVDCANEMSGITPCVLTNCGKYRFELRPLSDTDSILRKHMQLASCRSVDEVVFVCLISVLSL